MIIPQKLLGDCRQTLPTVPEKSVHCCITSIPYWGLRSYLPKGHPLKPLEIGCEPTFELYLDHISDAFKAVHRVLRDDGTLWVNVGDCYHTGAGKVGSCPGGGPQGEKFKAHFGKHTPGSAPAMNGLTQPNRMKQTGLKPKDMMLMPTRVAMRLQADGWYLRSMIPWIKRNAMPESCEDRPATATEYVFLLSKSPRYFYDRHAVMMPVSANTNARVSQATLQTQMGGSKQEAYRNDPENGQVGRKSRDRTPAEILKHMGRSAASMAFPGSSARDGNRRRNKTLEFGDGNKNNESMDAALVQMVSARNRRNSDWFMESFQGLLTDEDGEPLALIVNPKGTTIQHFASYPPKLVEPFIKAGTSEGGCCAQCGAPLKRVIELGAPDLAHQQACGGDSDGLYDGQAVKDFNTNGVQNASDVKRRILEGMREKKTTGWNRTCEHEGAPVPCTVLDPFAGTSTTAEVATRLGRHSIVCELNPEYFESARIRDSQTGLALL